ncbi:MAG TPA: aldo/keto reductase [Candidatus Hodarchaeales archaeon]|nr:aldo/keto reductase [Candidatus Hodarchaeales archaeon]
MLTYHPLACGVLTAKYKEFAPLLDSLRSGDVLEHYYNEKTLKTVESVSELALSKGCSAAQIALSWMRGKKGSIPIIGASNVQQLEELIGSLDAPLTEYEMKQLDSKVGGGMILFGYRWINV